MSESESKQQNRLTVLECATREGKRLQGRGSANAVEQGYQAGTVLVGYRGEFETQSAVGSEMTHDSFRANLSFLNKHIQLHFRAKGRRNRRG